MVASSVDTERFPFTEKEEEVLAIAKRTDVLVNGKYGMNYTRFFIGAVCGIVAVMLLSSRLSKVIPSLVNVILILSDILLVIKGMCCIII